MSRKVYFAGSLFVALLTLVLSLALTWVATEAQAPATLAAVPAIGTQQDQNRVLGHARTDETTPRSVQNARIIATRVGVGEQITALTDAMGAYTLTLPVGIATWSVAAEATESTIPAGAVAPNQPRLLVFGRGAETKAGIDFTFHIDTTNTASLQGHVMTPEDQPVAGVRVVAIKIDSLVSGGRLQVPTIRYTETGAQGEFAMMVDAGTWWVAVTLGADDPYMPYRLQWQTIVTVADGQTVDNMVLRVAPATARIHGALVREGSGEPATDACGIVAAFKQGEPAVYTYRTFTGASFDLPVTQGTYRVAVIPNPNLPVGSISLPAYLPSSSPTQIATCEAGKYLVRTLPQVTVEGPETDVVVPLRAAETTIHGRLWDLGSQQAVTGVQGLIFGWSPELSDSGGSSQGTWSAAPINPETGVGDLRAGSGDWLLAYQVDPNSSYHVAPGVITMTVPPGVPEIDVSLPVVGAESMVNGRVVAPDGSGVPGVLVVAAGISQLPGATGSLPGGGSIPASFVGDVAVVTDEDGSFTLGLEPGVYVVGVFGPPELLQAGGDQPWISPQPQMISLVAGEPAPPLVLQFRTGNATLHGQLRLINSVQGAAASNAAQLPALVWAATASGRTTTVGHTKTLVAMSPAGEGLYSLPAIQGQRWLVGAMYEVGTSLWITQTVVTVDRADISLDLGLVQAHLPSMGLLQNIDPDLPFYGELENGASIYVPAGALLASNSKSSGGEARSRALVSLQTGLMGGMAGVATALLPDVYMPNQPSVPDVASTNAANSADRSGLLLSDRGTLLVSPVYTFVERELFAGAEMADASVEPGAIESRLREPTILRIPYDAEALAAYGIPESAIRVMHIPYDELPAANRDAGQGAIDARSAGWESVSSYVVDQDNNQVVIFADEMGGYGLITTVTRWRTYVPLLLISQSHP